MKITILKCLIAPIIFFISYINLDQFVFKFDAKQGYLNKRIVKTNKSIEELEREATTLAKDKQQKKFVQLSKELQELKKLDQVEGDKHKVNINIYKVFEENELILFSENLRPSKASDKALQKVINFTLMGSYQNIIKMLKDTAESTYIPISFSLHTQADSVTKYTIAMWNKE